MNKYSPINPAQPKSLLLVNDWTSILLVIIWIGLLIYVIVLTNQKPVDEEDKDYDKKANEFSYVTTLFSLVSFIIYFRFFPLGWKNNSTMKFINLIIGILTTIFLLMLNHKSKTKGKKTSELSPFQTYQRNLVPFTATIFTLAAYSLTGTVNNFFGEALVPTGLTSMFDIIFPGPKKAYA
jgi:hypothetical protein